jgi:hypothetical protein
MTLSGAVRYSLTQSEGPNVALIVLRENDNQAASSCSGHPLGFDSPPSCRPPGAAPNTRSPDAFCLVADPGPGSPTVSCTPFLEMLAVKPRPPTERLPPRFERLIQMPGRMRSLLRKRKPIGFWFLCCERSIEVFPLGSPAMSRTTDRATPLSWPFSTNRNHLVRRLPRRNSDCGTDREDLLST